MLQRFVDSAAIGAEIERVRSLSGGALRRRWQSVFGRSPPEHLTADLLRRMIAARIQEEVFGTFVARGGGAGPTPPANIAERRVSAQNGHPTLSQQITEAPRSRIWH
jgi:hypothetical protein